MKKIVFYITIIIIFSFLFVNCEKEQVHINNETAGNAYVGIKYLKKDKFPQFIKEFTQKHTVNSQLQKNNGSFIETSLGLISFDELIEVKDINGNINYTATVKPKKSSPKIFYNFVINKNDKTPYIYEYKMSDAFALKNLNGDANFNEFTGSIKKYKLTQNQSNNTTKAKAPTRYILYPQPCPKETVIGGNSGGNTIPNNNDVNEPEDPNNNSNNNSTGGGSDIQSQNCRLVVEYSKCDSGGNADGHGRVCQHPNNIHDQPDNNEHCNDRCSGSKFKTAYLTNGCDTDNNNQKKSVNKSDSEGSCYNRIGIIGVYIPDIYAGYFDTLIENLSLNENKIKWLADKVEVAFPMFLFLEKEKWSQQAINFAIAAINTYINGGEVNFEERIIIDKTLKDMPCQKDIVEKSYQNKSDLANTVKNVFNSLSPTNMHLKFGVKDLPYTGQLGSTSPEVEIESNSTDPTIKQNTINIYFDTDFLNQGTDLAIAATSIHEQVHALLVYANHTGVLQVTAALNPNNPTYAELLQAFAEYQDDPQDLTDSQHDYMTSMVNEMTDDLFAFAKLKGIDADKDYCKKIMWGKLTETETFKSKYPKFQSDGDYNPEYIEINQASNAEAKDEDKEYEHSNGTTYTASPKGTKCN